MVYRKPEPSDYFMDEIRERHNRATRPDITEVEYSPEYGLSPGDFLIAQNERRRELERELQRPISDRLKDNAYMLENSYSKDERKLSALMKEAAEYIDSLHERLDIEPW